MATESLRSRAAAPIDLPALLSRCIGKTNLRRRVLESFLSQSSVDLELLAAAIGKSDDSEIARLAHRLRGTSLSVSATGFAAIAYELEEVAETASLDEVLRLTVELQNEHHRIVDFVRSTENAV